MYTLQQTYDTVGRRIIPIEYRDPSYNTRLRQNTPHPGCDSSFLLLRGSRLENQHPYKPLAYEVNSISMLDTACHSQSLVLFP